MVDSEGSMMGLASQDKCGFASRSSEPRFLVSWNCRLRCDKGEGLQLTR